MLTKKHVKSDYEINILGKNWCIHFHVVIVVKYHKSVSSSFKIKQYLIRPVVLFVPGKKYIKQNCL